MKKLIYMSIISALIFAGCGKKKVEKEIVEKPKYVVTEAIAERKMSQIFKSDAVLEPEYKVDHKTEKGGTIEKIFKKNGEKVKKGELVIKLTDAVTEENFISSESLYKVAKNNYIKFKKLYDENLISYLEYVNYENTYSTAKASYEIAKSDYDKLSRKAEIDGYVGNLFGKLGNEVDGNTTLFTVVNDKTMESYIGFPAEWLNQIEVNGSLKIEVPAVDKTYDGKILEINPIADTVTKKYMIKISIDNTDGRVKDGMYSYATIPVGSVSSMTVPDESIFIRNLQNYIFVIENGVAKRVEVQVGAKNPPYTTISSEEIKLGDKVVVKGLFGLEEGAKVEESLEK